MYYLPIKRFTFGVSFTRLSTNDAVKLGLLSKCISKSTGQILSGLFFWEKNMLFQKNSNKGIIFEATELTYS